MEYFDEALDVICPDCRSLIHVELSVGFQPTFWLHYRGPRHASCRLCLYRHPTTREPVVRVVPSHLTFRDYLPLVVAELRAITGSGGSPRCP